jgi:tRNA(Ile)-lysidine synthase TilS/MesJ
LRDAGDAFDRALAFVQERGVLRRRERALLACGGGAASVGMVAFVALAQRQLGLAQIAVVTVDDGSDDGSERCVEAARVARQLGLEVHVVERERGRATVAQARAIAREGGWSVLALGETIEDAAARTLRELMSEAPVRGLCARRKDGVCRPLLGSTIAEADAISAWAGVALPGAPPAPAQGERALDRAVREAILPRIRAFWPDADRSLAGLRGRVNGAPRHRNAST